MLSSAKCINWCLVIWRIAFLMEFSSRVETFIAGGGGPSTQSGEVEIPR